MIKSVDKALGILSYMIDEGTSAPVSLGAIAGACGLNQSTCAHLVETLCANAFLEKVSRRDGYILGPMGYRISAQQYYRQELIDSALPVMKRLSMGLREDSTLSTFSHSQLFVPLTVFYHDDGCSTMKLKTGNLYRSAAGRVFIAHMTRRQVDALIESVGQPTQEAWRAASDRAEMDAALAEIRRQGLCAIHRVTDGLSAVSAPIIVGGRVQAAVGVYMQADRFEGEHLEAAKRQTARAAKRVSERLAEKLAGQDNVVYTMTGVADG